MEEGPTSGTTRKPSRCAASTSAAPGSAIAGQPASDSRPSDRFARSGASGSRVLADHLDAQLADRHAQRAEERARALRVFDDEIAAANEPP